MKKSGFTMIELIFVIVVLGILAAVALPKFQAVGKQAHVGNLKSFTGTLNGTVGPSLWSQAIADNDGNISAVADSNGSKYIDIPNEIANAKLDLTKCDDTTKYKVVAKGKDAVNGGPYEIGCRDGNGTDAPAFALYTENKDYGDECNESKKIFPK